MLPEWKGAENPCHSLSERSLTKYFSFLSGSLLDEAIAPVKSLLYLGIAYRLNYDFDKAIASFNDYLHAIDDEDTDNRSLAEFHIERCKKCQGTDGCPRTIHRDTLPDFINTAGSNFNPVISAMKSSFLYGSAEIL